MFLNIFQTRSHRCKRREREWKNKLTEKVNLSKQQPPFKINENYFECNEHRLVKFDLNSQTHILTNYLLTTATDIIKMVREIRFIFSFSTIYRAIQRFFKGDSKKNSFKVYGEMCVCVWQTTLDVACKFYAIKRFYIESS